MKKKIIAFIVLFTISSAALYVSYGLYRKVQGMLQEQIRLEKRREEWRALKRALEKKIAGFQGTVGLVIEDLNTEQEIAFNKDALMPSASLVKVPIMLSYFYAGQEGKVNLKDTLRLKASDIVGGSKVLAKEPAGSRFQLEELFDPMITESDNAAANLLIDFMGFDKLNAYFKRLGLKNTNISRKMMDFSERNLGEENYTTAADMAYLLEKLYDRKFLNKDISEKCMEILGQQKINDRIPRKLPSGTYVIHKTGLENHICHDVGIVFTNNGDFLICVLAKHRDKIAKPTKKFISDIAYLTYNYYRNLD